MAANDHSRLGNVTQDHSHDYTKVMAYCQDETNWFMRARRLDPSDKWFEQPLPFEGDT